MEAQASWEADSCRYKCTYTAAMTVQHQNFGAVIFQIQHDKTLKNKIKIVQGSMMDATDLVVEVPVLVSTISSPSMQQLVVAEIVKALIQSLQQQQQSKPCTIWSVGK